MLWEVPGWVYIYVYPPGRCKMPPFETFGETLASLASLCAQDSLLECKGPPFVLRIAFWSRSDRARTETGEKTYSREKDFVSWDFALLIQISAMF